MCPSVVLLRQALTRWYLVPKATETDANPEPTWLTATPTMGILLPDEVGWGRVGKEQAVLQYI